MKIGNSQLGDIAVIRLEGRMDAESWETFQDAGDRLIQGSQKQIAIDLSALIYISSAGIGALVRLQSLQRERVGVVVLCGVHGMVKTVLQITRILTLFQVFDSLDEAVAALAFRPQ